MTLSVTGTLTNANRAEPHHHTLRPYQKRIVQEVSRHGSSIIVLPTGAGKTHAAAELVRIRLAQEPTRSVVFVVPTVQLVQQQAGVLRSWLNDGPAVYEYSGGQSCPPAAFRVLVTTPEAFAKALERGTLPGAASPDLAEATTTTAAATPPGARYSLVVFDEVHHHLKDHPYRRVADALRGGGRGGGGAGFPTHLHILGLTATLSYAVGEAATVKSIDKLRAALEIKHIATAAPEELEAGGYHGRTTRSVVDTVDAAVFRTLGVVPVADRVPHKLLPVFLQRCSTGAATPAARLLLQLSQALERHATSIIGPSFRPPTNKGVSTWGAAAGKLYQQAVDTKKGDSNTRRQKMRALEWLMHSYEAVRIAVVSWEEQAAEGAAMYLRMNGIVPGSPVVTQAVEQDGMPDEVVALLKGYYDAASASGTPRFDHLKAHLLKLFEARQRAAAADESDAAGERDAKAFHGIVFAEQRVMAHVLAWFAGTHDPELAACFRTAVVHAQEPATHLLRMSKAQVQRAIEGFKTKEANLLVATNAAEEGMDVPAANVVLRFDPMHTAVSLVQGRGRARAAHSDHVVLNQRDDRTVEALQATERCQARLILKQYGEGNTQQAAAATAAAVAAASQAQRSREANARTLLLQQRPSDTAVMHLHAFCTKTKLSPLYKESRKGAAFVCDVTVTTGTAGTVTGAATCPTKQAAKHAAAADAIAQLRQRFE